ncbi:hypothetical protein L2E82_14230 [Cichorium intybus]|uniref:Uncharacterized protein n=1 Tax=Cichorium intybus TaxID=13427 RepID=A0ACB9F013_CICIN|nr:hypothetical protein L2E82_14230 [Cichorium intybus]
MRRYPGDQTKQTKGKNDRHGRGAIYLCLFFSIQSIEYDSFEVSDRSGGIGKKEMEVRVNREPNDGRRSETYLIRQEGEHKSIVKGTT